MKKIIDEFTNLPISRQLKYQKRHQKDNRCTFCMDLAFKGTSKCKKHLIAKRELSRVRQNCQKRYNSISYSNES